MKKEKAIEFLSFLHSLEESFKNNLFEQDKLTLIEKVREEFLNNFK